jgi:serine phosphatase RsbU (regulator of sigma subunit)
VFDDAKYEEGEVHLNPNDVLVFYTDGFTEINDAHQVEFGEERLTDAILKNRGHNPQVICQALMHEVLTHAKTASFEDDATVVVLKQLGVGVAP